MKGGVTTVEIKSGYALDVEGELRMLRCAAALAASEAVRIVPTLLALHALPPEYKDRREDYVAMIADELDPARRAREAGDERRRLLREHRLHAARGRARLHRGAGERPAGPPSRRAAVQPERRGARGQAQGAVGRPSRASRRCWRQGDGQVGHGGRAAARRLLRPSGKEEAAGRPAAQAQGADCHRDRLQSRHRRPCCRRRLR